MAKVGITKVSWQYKDANGQIVRKSFKIVEPLNTKSDETKNKT